LPPLHYFQSMKLTHRFWSLLSLFLPPFLLLLHFYYSAIEESLQENRDFAAGISQIQQLATFQEHVAQYRGLHHGQQLRRHKQSTEANENRALLSELHSKINMELETFENAALIQQNPVLFRSIQALWQQLAPASEARENSSNFNTYSQLIHHVHQLIGQIADRNTPHPNPLYPERIQIYSLSIHSIPALKEQMGQLRGLTYGALQQLEEIRENHPLNIFLPKLQEEIASNRVLIRDQLAHIYQHNPATYQESFSFFSDYSIELAALQEALSWELESLFDGSRQLQFFDSPEALFQQFSIQIELLDALSNALFAHVKNSLQQEQESIIKQRRVHLTLLFLLLLVVFSTAHWILSQQIQKPEPQQSLVNTQNNNIDNDSSFRQLRHEGEEKPLEQQTIRVLAVDDERIILDSYQATLSQGSNREIDQLNNILNDTSSIQHKDQTPTFMLDCVTQGETAVERIKDSIDTNTPYQVIYLDMQMPGGWDGLKTAQEILRIDPMARIIVISAWSEHSPAELKPILGNHFIYLRKPFRREELVQLTQYMAEDWRRTQQLTESKHTLSNVMESLQERTHQHEEELEHQRIYQMILATLSTSAPLYSGDRTAAYQEITQSTLEALGVDRVALWRIEEQKGELYLVADDSYNVHEQRHAQGEQHAAAEYQLLWERIQRRQVVRINDTAELSPDNSRPCYFRNNQIGSMMMAPIFYNNVQQGVISAEIQDHSREWRLEEATFLSYVSNLVPTIEVSAERKDAELRAETANKAKDDFLATMSHELRTPLSSMIGYGDILSESRLTNDQQELVNTIALSGKTLLALVNDILDISKIEAGKFELDHAPFSLQSLSHEMEMMFSPKAKLEEIAFTIEAPSPPPTTLLSGDERRIAQILINLIGNALKFTRQGSVKLHISNDPPQQQEEEKQVAQYHFAVVDSGIGIAENVVDRLFKPFEQADGSISRSFGGTGLGLYISRVLAHLMGGDIQLESIENKGSTFTLSVPLEVTSLALPEAGTETDHSKNSQTRLQGHVLIVEDTPELQQLERRLVEVTGATVDTASDGEEGMALALSGSYNLILMDMQMPKMDGITATQLLRASSVSTPIVALTANVMQQHREQFHAAGCTGFLSKPIDRSALYKVLSSYLQADDNHSGKPVAVSDEMPISGELNEMFQQSLHKSLVLRPILPTSPQHH